MDKKTFIREYAASHRYFSLKEVVKAVGVSVQVAKNYLLDLKQEGVVFPAGQGIYSSIKEEFRPQEKRRVADIRRLIKKHYPDLDFIVWNTLCFQPYYHHQQTHHITFVEVEYDGVHSVADSLSRDYRYVLVDKPGRHAPKGFDITKDPIVVKALFKGSPRHGHSPAVEKMLVDLFVIKDKFSTMGDADYWELLESIDDFYRVNVGDLARYARRSRNLEAILSQLIGKIGINEVTFGTYLESVSKVTYGKDGHGKIEWIGPLK
ncbi:MAG: hypothetical protein HQL22_06930 [Candidatus Omnitrophica bacterium]|nr:hypothetical protein [Candidatus Omnitrophota bacterium]